MIANHLIRGLLRFGLFFLVFVVVTAEKIEVSFAVTPFILTQGHGSPFEDQWLGTPPSIQAMLVTESGRVYAGSFGMGMFRSEDQGSTWKQVNAGLTDFFILCLASDSTDTIYAGTVRGGVFRSFDRGEHWESIREGLKQVEVKALLVHPTGLYAGTGKGVYIWREDGALWVPKGKGLEQILVSSLVMIEDHTLLAGTAGKGLYRLDTSMKSGKQWEEAGGDFIDPKEHLHHKFIRILSVGQDLRLYVGTQDGGIYFSEDSGKTWHSLGRRLPNDSIRSILSTRAGLLVATGRGIFKKAHDQKWHAIHSGITDLSIQVLIDSPKGPLYAGTSSGAFRSDDQGQSWIDVSQGFGIQKSIPRPYF